MQHVLWSLCRPCGVCLVSVSSDLCDLLGRVNGLL